LRSGGRVERRRAAPVPGLAVGRRVVSAGEIREGGVAGRALRRSARGPRGGGVVHSYWGLALRTWVGIGRRKPTRAERMAWQPLVRELFLGWQGAHVRKASGAKTA